jgi:AcrR family transcriptional regulator
MSGPTSALVPFKKAERGDEQREAKRSAILRSAAKIFNQRGYHRTSVADVAEALGVSKPFLYYYLRNKEDILFECSRIATEELHAVLDAVRRAEAPGFERLEMLFRGYARVMTTDFGICLIRNSVPGALPSESWEKLRAGRRRLNKEVERLVALGIADGSIRSCDPKLLSFALFGAFNWIAFWFREDRPLRPEAVADYFMDIFARGVAAAAPTKRKS